MLKMSGKSFAIDTSHDLKNAFKYIKIKKMNLIEFTSGKGFLTPFLTKY